MKNKHTVCFSAILLFMFSGEPAMATEEPAFAASLKEGAFEVRIYPALVAAQVRATGTRDEASSAGFKLLAGYIFGGNTRRQSIAMTAPVVQSKPGSETIAMTAPVIQTAMPDHPEAWTVRFIMPAAFTMDTLPTPNDARVQLLALPPARYAVVMFSGLAHEEDVAQKTAELTAFMAEHALRAAGPPALARYNPPWTLRFMRRNEVHIPVAP
jgi:hypothetical protein